VNCGKLNDKIISRKTDNCCSVFQYRSIAEKSTINVHISTYNPTATVLINLIFYQYRQANSNSRGPAYLSFLNSGASYCPDLLQVPPEVSWIRWYLEVRPHLLPKLDMCRELQYHVLCHFFCAIAVGARGRVLSPKMMKVDASRGHQPAQICAMVTHLVSRPATLPASMWQDAVRQHTTVTLTGLYALCSCQSCFCQLLLVFSF